MTKVIIDQKYFLVTVIIHLSIFLFLQSYESWLQSVAASIKDAQEKAKKSNISQKKEAAPAPVAVGLEGN